jgi:hypothetical protein
LKSRSSARLPATRPDYPSVDRAALDEVQKASMKSCFIEGESWIPTSASK